MLAECEDSHKYITTEADLSAYSLATKRNYGPGTDEDMFEFFPVEWFAHQRYYIAFYESLRSLINYLKDEYNDIFHVDVDLVAREYKMTCTSTLCLFLIYMFRHVSTQFYKELVVFLIFLRYEFNTIFENVQFAEVDISKEDPSYSEVEEANLLPEILNIFVLDSFKKYIEDPNKFLNKDFMEHLKPTSINLNKVITVCKFLSEWLYHFNFTELSVVYMTNLGTIIPMPQMQMMLPR